MPQKFTSVKDNTTTINSVKSKTSPDKNLKTYTIEKKNESPEEYLKRRRRERKEKLDKILNNPSTKLDSQKTDLSLFVDKKKQESQNIGKTIIILGAAIVGGGIAFNFVSVPVFMVASYSAGQSTLIGYKFEWITYSLAAYAAAISGIKMYEFTTSEAAEKLQEPIGKVGTSLLPLGKPAFDFWHWFSKFVPNFIINILWLIYKIIITLWNLITTILSIPIFDFFNFGFDHVAILLFCGIVFYLLFYQGSPIDILLLFVPWVLIFSMIHLGYKIKNYFYPPIEEE